MNSQSADGATPRIRSRYEKEIWSLTDWFAEKLAPLPTLVVTRAEYRSGIDALEKEHKEYHELTKQAFTTWLEKHHYELSYNQMCQGFFGAALEAGKLEIRE